MDHEFSTLAFALTTNFTYINSFSFQCWCTIAPSSCRFILQESNSIIQFLSERAGQMQRELKQKWIDSAYQKCYVALRWVRLYCCSSCFYSSWHIQTNEYRKLMYEKLKAARVLLEHILSIYLLTHNAISFKIFYFTLKWIERKVSQLGVNCVRLENTPRTERFDKEKTE